MGLVYKLLMNSAYRSLLQNPALYKNVKYVKSHTDVLKLANEPFFSQLSELDCDDEFYEVQMYKIGISDARTPQPDRDLNVETLLVKL